MNYPLDELSVLVNDYDPTIILTQWVFNVGDALIDTIEGKFIIIYDLHGVCMRKPVCINQSLFDMDVRIIADWIIDSIKMFREA